MKFLKENSYDIVRLFINQIGITIFALVLYTAIGDGKDALKVALSIFATLFYFVLIYTASWEYGAKDKVRIDTGKMRDDRLKGFKLGILANLLNIIFAIASVLTLGIYMSSGSEGMFSAFAIINMFMRFIMAMYIGMLTGIFSTETQNLNFLGESIGYIVFPFIAAGVVAFGYGMGKRNKRIFPSSKPTIIK